MRFRGILETYFDFACDLVSVDALCQSKKSSLKRAALSPVTMQDACYKLSFPLGKRGAHAGGTDIFGALDGLIILLVLCNFVQGVKYARLVRYIPPRSYSKDSKVA